MKKSKEIILLLALMIVFISCNQNNPIIYDIVLKNGRIIDPETNTDKVMNVGIKDGKIEKLSLNKLKGTKIIDVSNKVVAPGAIDMHHHSPTPFAEINSNRDGVTTILELEGGAFPILGYGTALEGKSHTNFGCSTAHSAARTKVIESKDLPYYEAGNMGTKAWKQKPTEEQIEEMRKLLHQGLDDGGIGIGLLLDYMTDAITDAELKMIFEVAKERNTIVYCHVRRYINGNILGLNEVLKWSLKTGAALHICHINANAMGNYKNWLAAIDEANKKGADITTEIFPYTAGSTSISADVFGRDWQKIFNITYKDVQWGETGEYFTSLEQFNTYREEQPKGATIHHYMKEEWIKNELKYPEMIIATDAMPTYSKETKVVPNGIGSYTKILTKYVRDEKWISLMDAISMTSYKPAKRLEIAAPLFKKKGRIQEGMDADIRIFDLNNLETKASFTDPFQLSTGYDYIIVGGEIVVKNDATTNATPGKRILSNKNN